MEVVGAWIGVIMRRNIGGHLGPQPTKITILRGESSGRSLTSRGGPSEQDFVFVGKERIPPRAHPRPEFWIFGG